MKENPALNARQQGVTTVLTQMIARLLLVPIFMVAAGILVKGYADVGDGFSAGVVAALGIVLQDVTLGHRVVDRMALVRHAPAGAFLGLTIALLVAFLPLLRRQEVMTHAPGPGAEVIHLGTLEVLTAVAFDVGVFLLVFGFAVSAIGMVARAHRRLPESP